MCKSLNLKFVNGRLGTDKDIGSFTYISNIGRSTIDYAVVSPDLFEYISNFEVDILDKNLSDYHCPIILTLKVQHFEKNAIVYEEPLVSDIIFNPVYSKWEPSKKQDYQDKFEYDRFDNLIDMLELLETEGPSQEGIDDAAKELCNIYLRPAIEIGISKKIMIGNANEYKSKKTNKAWFDKDCVNKRKHFFKIKNKLKKSKSRRNDLILDREERIYRKFIRYKKNLFCKNIHDKLRSLKSKNPKEYWNILKFSKSKKTHSLNINNMYEHFKELNENINSDLHNFEPNDIMVNNNNEINSDFTLEEVEILVNKLKNNKATGLDNIINDL